MGKLLLICGLVVIGAFGATTPAAAAGAVSTGTGTGTVVSFALTPVRTAGGNLIFSVDETIFYTGVLTGVATSTATVIIHPNGTTTGHGTETCNACTIDGMTGSFTSVVTATGTADLSQVSANFAILNASGGLAGLHATGSAAGSAFSYTYTLMYHF